MSFYEFRSQQKIGIIGAGVAGIAAAHLLSKKHDVTIFEASPKIGGHANSVTLTDDEVSFDVDTAFLIFNDLTYPNYLKFLNELNVYDQSIRAEMSSCFSDEIRGLHYSLGNGWSSVLARPQNYLRKELFQIGRDLASFRRRARRDLNQKYKLQGITAGEYLKPYSKYFVDNFVLPLTAAIWSLPSAKIRDYPILSLLEYFDNHQLLGGRRGKHWRTFKNSSRVYIDAFVKQFKGTIETQSMVRGVRRNAGGVAVISAKGERTFDHVVLATHADTALTLIKNPSERESALLSPWRYQPNVVTLHRDPSFLYPCSEFWCSWNMARKKDDYQISYYLNRLQRLPSKKPVILTVGDIDPAIGDYQKFNYRHPVYNELSVATQAQLPSLNGVDRLHFCGSYFGFGFHEDAVRSAAMIARQFGIGWSKGEPNENIS